MPLSDQVQPGEETSVKTSKFPPYPHWSTKEEETAKFWAEKPKKRRLSSSSSSSCSSNNSKAEGFTVPRKTPKEEQIKIVADKAIPVVKEDKSEMPYSKEILNW